MVNQGPLYHDGSASYIRPRKLRLPPSSPTITKYLSNILFHTGLSSFSLSTLNLESRQFLCLLPILDIHPPLQELSKFTLS